MKFRISAVKVRPIRTLPLTTATSIALAMAHAASIAWQTPVAETGSASDVLNNGTVVAAIGDPSVLQGGTITVNGVTFNDGSALTQAGGASYFDGESVPSVVTDPGYADLLGSGSVIGSTYLIDSGDLVTGDEYQIQLFQPAFNYGDGTSTTAVYPQGKTSFGVLEDLGPATPEPSTIVLGGFALLAIGLVQWRRSRKVLLANRPE